MISPVIKFLNEQDQLRQLNVLLLTGKNVEIKFSKWYGQRKLQLKSAYFLTNKIFLKEIFLEKWVEFFHREHIRFRHNSRKISCWDKHLWPLRLFHSMVILWKVGFIVKISPTFHFLATLLNLSTYAYFFFLSSFSANFLHLFLQEENYIGFIF